MKPISASLIIMSHWEELRRLGVESLTQAAPQGEAQEFLVELVAKTPKSALASVQSRLQTLLGASGVKLRERGV